MACATTWFAECGVEGSDADAGAAVARDSQMNVAVLKYFALSCAGAAFAVAIGEPLLLAAAPCCFMLTRAVSVVAVHKNEDIKGVVDFLAKLHNHHFASLVCSA